MGDDNDDKKGSPTPPKGDPPKADPPKAAPPKADPPKAPAAKVCHKPPPAPRNEALDEAVQSISKAVAGGVQGFMTGAAKPFAPPAPAKPKPPPIQVGKLTLPHPTDPAAQKTLEEVERQIDAVIADAVRGALDGAVRGVAKSIPKPAPPKKPTFIYPLAKVCFLLGVSAAVGVMFLVSMGAHIPYPGQLAFVLFLIGLGVSGVVNLLERMIRK